MGSGGRQGERKRMTNGKIREMLTSIFRRVDDAWDDLSNGNEPMALHKLEALSLYGQETLRVLGNIPDGFEGKHGKDTPV